MATVTMSPGRMRIKCLRIFPAMWAMISWPLSSLTRNCVLARACVTLPWTRYGSSFAIPSSAEIQNNFHWYLYKRFAKKARRFCRGAAALPQRRRVGAENDWRLANHETRKSESTKQAQSEWLRARLFFRFSFFRDFVIVLIRY